MREQGHEGKKWVMGMRGREGIGGEEGQWWKTLPHPNISQLEVLRLSMKGVCWKDKEMEHSTRASGIHSSLGTQLRVTAGREQR